METREWLRNAEKAGWLIRLVDGRSIELICGKHGCNEAMQLPLANLGPIPQPCSAEHRGRYARKTFEGYEALVSDLRRKRQQLGLSQPDLDAAIGFPDGYVAKLESLQRVITGPTLQLWMLALGLKFSHQPAPLPNATRRAIEDRVSRPYRADQVRGAYRQQPLMLEGPANE